MQGLSSPTALPYAAPRSPVPPRSPRPQLPHMVQPKDFSYLLRPEIYHPVTSIPVPAAFRTSHKQPPADAALEDLLAMGHYRAAAIAATQELTGTGGGGAAGRTPPDPADHARIFSLLYARLACLTLVEATALAAQEVKALEDLNSAFYRDDVTGEHLVPWELRVLNVRLQAMGFGDPRRAVMGYYDLARDARAQLAAAAARHDNSARELWKARLAELGVKVAGALVEMDDLAGAASHLAGLGSGGSGGPAPARLCLARALLWLHLGDVEAARQAVRAAGGQHSDGDDDSGATVAKVVAALCHMADGEYGQALLLWRELLEREKEEGQGDDKDEMIAVNAAVCMLYVGKMPQARELLESLVDRGNASHTLLFNLTTMYELCTEKARALKVRLTERVADLDESVQGWEKVSAAFKL